MVSSIKNIKTRGAAEEGGKEGLIERGWAAGGGKKKM